MFINVPQIHSQTKSEFSLVGVPMFNQTLGIRALTKNIFKLFFLLEEGGFFKLIRKILNYFSSINTLK
jgi:hypothetical protein